MCGEFQQSKSNCSLDYHTDRSPENNQEIILGNIIQIHNASHSLECHISRIDTDEKTDTVENGYSRIDIQEKENPVNMRSVYDL